MPQFTLHPKLAADSIELGNCQICKVLLINDSNYPWLVLVPRRGDIRELYQLEQADIEQVQRESLEVSKLLMQHFKGDKLNVAALGNLVPQLHIHHIVRFENDAAWPKPIWGVVNAVAYKKNELDKMSESLRTLLSSTALQFKPC